MGPSINSRCPHAHKHTHTHTAVVLTSDRLNKLVCFFHMFTVGFLTKILYIFKTSHFIITEATPIHCYLVLKIEPQRGEIKAIVILSHRDGKPLSVNPLFVGKPPD